MHYTLRMSETDLPDGADVDLGPLPRLLGYALRRAQLAVFQDFHRVFAEVDIRPAQFSVLTVLRHTPGLRQSQVSEALGIKRTNFVALFDTLEARGLARRERVADDRRAFALYLTEEGAGLLGRMQALLAAHEKHFIDRIGADGRETLLALLHRLSD